VGQNKTDNNDPNFDAFQDIQPQNHFSTMQLTIMGYKGKMLRVQYGEDKVRALQAAAPVTVPQTHRRQEALAAANTNGKKSFVTGGKHITSDNMFKSVKILSQKAESVEREKDKKRRVEYHTRHKATLLVLNRLKNKLENAVARLTSEELEVLRRWKSVPVS